MATHSSRALPPAIKRRQVEPQEIEEWAQQLVDEGVASDISLARTMMRNPSSWPHAED